MLSVCRRFLLLPYLMMPPWPGQLRLPHHRLIHKPNLSFIADLRHACDFTGCVIFAIRMRPTISCSRYS